LGAGALNQSTLLRELNIGNYTAAANEFPRWVNAGGQRLPGLVRRRAAERELFLS
jgi:lysozyme